MSESQLFPPQLPADGEPAQPADRRPAIETPRPVSRRHDLIAAGILTILATLFFADVLVGVNNFYMRDLTRYYYPTKHLLREIVYGGEFPLWNPYFSAGQPIAANPEHEVFYPLTWLLLLPSYDLGYRLHILVHIYIGLLGMYALLRSMQLRPAAAAFGALTFGLGGIYLSYINLLPILFCAAWLPLTCLYTRKFLLRPSVRDFALASLFLGLQFLVGEPTTVMQTGFILGMYALYRAWYSPRRVKAAIAKVASVGAISIVGLAAGLAQALPAMDHVTDSARSRAFDFTLVKAWSMPWAKYAELIFPNILGHISVKNVMWYWGGGLYAGMGSPFLFSIYCGLLMAALVVGGAFVRARGGRFVLILAIFSSLIALGGNTPLLKWMYDAGVATSIRYPEKFALIGIFAMIIFGSQMLERLIARDEELRDSTLGFSLAVLVVSAVVAISTFTPYYGRYFMKIWGLTAGRGTSRMVELSGNDWIVAAVRAAIVVLLIWSIRWVKLRVWIAAAAIFVIADLGLVVHELNPRMPSRFFTEPPAVNREIASNRRDFRVFHEADWYGTEATARKYFSTGSAVYWVVRGGLFPMTPAGVGIATVMERDYDKTALVPTIDLVDSVWDLKRAGVAEWWKPFMAMSNAWYRGVYRDFDEEKKRTKGRFADAKPIRFEEGPHYPRYYFADRLVTIKDRHDFVKKLTEKRWSSAVAFTTMKAFAPSTGRVVATAERANSARIEVESDGTGFLVMSVTPHKYWNVTVDGRRVEPVITNVGYQGITVPRGRHVVEMRYRNRLIEIGAAVSAATLLLLLLTIALSRRPTAA